MRNGLPEGDHLLLFKYIVKRQFAGIFADIAPGIDSPDQSLVTYKFAGRDPEVGGHAPARRYGDAHITQAFRQGLDDQPSMAVVTIDQQEPSFWLAIASVVHRHADRPSYSLGHCPGCRGMGRPGVVANIGQQGK